MPTETASNTENHDWVRLRPSMTNLALTLVAPLGATAILFIIDLPDWLSAALMLTLLVVATVDIYRVRLKHRDAIGAFRLEPDAEGGKVGLSTSIADSDASGKQLLIRVRYANGSVNGVPREVDGRVLDRAYVSAYFTSIPYKLPGDKRWRNWLPRQVVIWADAVDREQFRQVRVRLKWR